MPGPQESFPELVECPIKFNPTRKMDNLLTIKKASLWASEHLGKNVTPSNILYLVQYGRIPKHGENGTITVSQEDLFNYYENARRETAWREKLGEDLNWALSFDNLKEKETTKHVHRLHPYKGKFIPQLVEYFIDNHKDNFKTKTYFRKGDIILDPFSGSGTTLVQANELGIHAVGVDISAFNSLIANVKVSKINFQNLNDEIRKITAALDLFISEHTNIRFENELLHELNVFNKRYFPSPEFKIRIRRKDIVERDYVPAKEEEFAVIYDKLRKKYRLNIEQDRAETFLEKWYIKPIRKELDFVHEQLKAVKNPATQKILTVILSRTIRYPFMQGDHSLRFGDPKGTRHKNILLHKTRKNLQALILHILLVATLLQRHDKPSAGV